MIEVDAPADHAGLQPKLSHAGLLMGSQIVKWSLRLVFVLVVARALGPKELGVYALIFAMLEFFWNRLFRLFDSRSSERCQRRLGPGFPVAEFANRDCHSCRTYRDRHFGTRGLSTQNTCRPRVDGAYDSSAITK